MIGYGTIRLFVEGLRSDSLYLLPGIRVSQVLSGCLIILGIVILFIIRKRQAVRQNQKNCIVADYNDTLFCRTRHVAFGSIKHSLCQLAVRNRAALLFLRKYTAHYSRLTDAAIVE